MYQLQVPKLYSLCSLLFLSQWFFLFLQRRGNLEDLLLKHFTEQPLSSSWRVLNSWKLDLTLPGYHTHTSCVTQALCGVCDPEQSSGRHAGVNHWNEPGHATVCQVFSLFKSQSAFSKTRQVEKVEDPTLSQKYFINSHVPSEWITNFQIQVIVLYCL